MFYWDQNVVLFYYTRFLPPLDGVQMNEKAAIKTPYLLFSPRMSLESLRSFK